MRRLSGLVSLAWLACGGDPSVIDAGPEDASTFDGGVDGSVDAGPADAGAPWLFDASFERRDVDVVHPLDDELRLNHVQAKGTHNSYHRLPPRIDLPDWRYEHSPLDVQLGEEGVRKFELDTWWDRHEERWHVYHVAVVDAETTCQRFIECLATIRGWSDANPGHHPIFVQVETKDPFDPDVSPARLEALDDDIRAVFPDELLVTPAMVQGDDDSLHEAITTRGWPTLGETRGRVLFFLNCGRAECVHYATDGLLARPAFPDSRDGDPWAAVRVMNDPRDPAIPSVVEAGLLVRTRAISMPSALELGEDALRAELDAALASGAHMISTDVPTPRDDVALHFEMPGGTPSRCNPRTAPASCTSEAIEDPARLAGD
ncbi:MAG: hypothetical protein KF901_12550 [Myxococcales bacterium]|nr:hypothetical protein [Myxococcales bacterium]